MWRLLLLPSGPAARPAPGARAAHTRAPVGRLQPVLLLSLCPRLLPACSRFFFVSLNLRSRLAAASLFPAPAHDSSSPESARHTVAFGTTRTRMDVLVPKNKAAAVQTRCCCCLRLSPLHVFALGLLALDTVILLLLYSNPVVASLQRLQGVRTCRLEQAGGVLPPPFATLVSGFWELPANECALAAQPRAPCSLDSARLGSARLDSARPPQPLRARTAHLKKLRQLAAPLAAHRRAGCVVLRRRCGARGGACESR